MLSDKTVKKIEKRYLCSFEYVTDKADDRFMYQDFTVNAPDINKAKDIAKEKFNKWAVSQQSNPRFTHLYCLG